MLLPPLGSYVSQRSFPSMWQGIFYQPASQISGPHPSFLPVVHLFTWLDNIGSELINALVSRHLGALQEHRNKSLPSKVEKTFKALHDCCLPTVLHGPVARASLLFSSVPGMLLPLGLCTCCFYHLEDSSSMVCSLTSFRFLFKIIFSEAFPDDPSLNHNFSHLPSLSFCLKLNTIK